MRKILSKFIKTRPIIKLIFGKKFTENQVPTYLLWRHVFYQKVLRINGEVPWPVHRTSTFKSPQRIETGGSLPGYAVGCYLDGRNGIIIGRNSLLGPGVKLISMNHDLCSFDEYIHDDPIIIGENCWIAANAVVLSGVQLADHTVVAAGSVVTKSFSQGNVLLGGVPARVIKKLGDYNNEEGET